MDRIYVLYRNGAQLGPLNEQELIELKPAEPDLVWIEGKSDCWLHPDDVPALKQARPAVAPFIAPHPALTPSQSSGTAQPQATPVYYPTMAARQRNWRPVAIGGGVVLLAAVIWLCWPSSKPHAQEQAVMNTAIQQPVIQELSTPAAAPVTAIHQPSLSASRSKVQPQAPHHNNIDLAHMPTVSTSPTVEASASTEALPNALPQGTTETASAPPAQEAGGADQRPTEGRKKMKTVIKDWFKDIKEKKTGSNTNKAEGPAPQPTSTDGNGARQSAHRDVDVDAIRDQLVLYGNDQEEGWMMGTRNIELTLRNPSKSSLGQVMVTVTYLDNQDKQLEQKTVYFRNVKPGGKQTLSVPPNRWADHLKYQVAQVQLSSDAYAALQ